MADGILQNQGAVASSSSRPVSTEDDDLGIWTGIRNGVLGGAVLWLLIIGVCALLTGCGGGSSSSDPPAVADPPTSTAQTAPPLPACPAGTTNAPLNCTCPANHLQGNGSCVVDGPGSTSAAPPPAPGAVVGAWMGDVSTSGKWTFSGGVCLAWVKPDGSEAPLICGDVLDYNGMVTGAYMSLNASGGWSSPNGSVRGDIWKWPVDSSGNLIGTRDTVGIYPVDYGLEQPTINATYPETWSLAFGYTGAAFFDTPPVNMSGFAPQVSLAGNWSGAYCNRVACSLVIGADGTVNGQDANGCVYSGTLTGALTSVATATITDCNGVTYQGAAVVAPKAASASMTDWSAPWIVILAANNPSAGGPSTTCPATCLAAGELVISNEYAPLVPTSP